ncbi:MAG: hypothetical protein MZV64_36615 [Ignavibacteriales bacterium]|nr:hypothetical protein [Ignavibacteriales bacterium]
MVFVLSSLSILCYYFLLNYAGLALIIFAIILFVLEIKVISHGILSIGGIISLVLGSMMLINEESILEAMEISMELIILVAILTAGFFSVRNYICYKSTEEKTCYRS